MSILKIESNLNHNGTYHVKGDFMEADASSFEQLISEGVLSVVEGANTIEEAKAMVEEAMASAVATEEAQAPENTWEAKKDETPVVENTEVVPPTEPTAPVETTGDATVPVIPPVEGDGKTGDVVDPTINTNL